MIGLNPAIIAAVLTYPTVSCNYESPKFDPFWTQIILRYMFIRFQEMSPKSTAVDHIISYLSPKPYF